MKINIDSLRVKYNVMDNICWENFFTFHQIFNYRSKPNKKKKLNKNSFTIVLYFEYAFYQNGKFIINIEHWYDVVNPNQIQSKKIP